MGSVISGTHSVSKGNNQRHALRDNREEKPHPYVSRDDRGLSCHCEGDRGGGGEKGGRREEVTARHMIP